MLSVTGQSVAVAGAAYVSRSDDNRTHIPVHVEISLGTASVNIEGRVSPALGWVVLATVSATDIVSVVKCPYMRANVTAAAGATIKVEGQGCTKSL